MCLIQNDQVSVTRIGVSCVGYTTFLRMYQKCNNHNIRVIVFYGCCFVQFNILLLCTRD
jgi:hypothetical protein